MLTTEVILDRIMAKLERIDPSVPLHKNLRPYLKGKMTRGPYYVRTKTLEWEGRIPRRAYYVVRGYVLIYGFDRYVNQYVFRIYGEDTIVALNCFMKQRVSIYTICACRDTYVWSISNQQMLDIYNSMQGMENMARQAAMDFSTDAEQIRTDLLALEDYDRVETFYHLYPELLPAKRSPVRDRDVAEYLDLSRSKFRRIRLELMESGRLLG